MNKKVSIYNLLKAVNFLFFVLMLYVYSKEGDNQYVDLGTICLNTIMMLISHFLLTDASKSRNHLLAVLSLVMIVHYELRIITLNYTEYSVVIDNRVNINSSGINYVMLYVIGAYLVSWLGFHYRAKATSLDVVNIDKNSDKVARNILILVYSCFFLDILGANGVPGITQVLTILSTFFFSLGHMLLFVMTFFIIMWKRISAKFKYLFFVFLIIYVVSLTLGGSRSAIYTIVVMGLFCALVSNKANFKLKYVLAGTTLVPLGILFFMYATLARGLNAKGNSDVDSKVVYTYLSDRIDGSEIKILVAPVFDRIAFFDYTVEMVHNKVFLSNYLTPVNYMKSIVDNLLTPGFNIFDMPKMSNVISKCYQIKGEPSVSRYGLTGEDYQSDGISWFGEAYLLFGVFFAIPVILLVGIVIKFNYNNLLRQNTVTAVWKRIIILYLMYTLLYSYGLDWLIIKAVSFVINYYIFKTIITEKKSKSVCIVNKV